MYFDKVNELLEVIKTKLNDYEKYDEEVNRVSEQTITLLMAPLKRYEEAEEACKGISGKIFFGCIRCALANINEICREYDFPEIFENTKISNKEAYDICLIYRDEENADYMIRYNQMIEKLKNFKEIKPIQELANFDSYEDASKYPSLFLKARNAIKQLNALLQEYDIPTIFIPIEFSDEEAYDMCKKYMSEYYPFRD